MPANDFSVARDVTLDVVGFDGVPRSFTLITGFEKKQLTQKIEVRSLDGVTRFAELPDGWEGGMHITRADRALDDYFADMEDTYYSTGYTNAMSITETIQEPGGGISQWRYERVVMRLENGGSWKGHGDVSQQVQWCASRRRKLV